MGSGGAGLGCIGRLWGGSLRTVAGKWEGWRWEGEGEGGCILMSCTRELLRNFPAGRGVRFVFS